ncbi:hypothetical protein TNCV_3817891 [Trichonephila clavipes]|nr:hypothetical protein TNCV_3817891 [Trichonephila clavipes]
MMDCFLQENEYITLPKKESGRENSKVVGTRVNKLEHVSITPIWISCRTTRITTSLELIRLPGKVVPSARG